MERDKERIRIVVDSNVIFSFIINSLLIVNRVMDNQEIIHVRTRVI